MRLLFFYAFLTILLISNSSFAQIADVNPELYAQFKERNFSSISTVKELVSQLKPLAKNNKESIQLLYFWTYQNMAADSVRFFKGGAPLTNQQAFSKRVGLCEEFSGIFDEFCQLNKIPTLKVRGYVRELDFKPKQVFEDGNHIWNAVFVDSDWLLCDLFWSITTLKQAQKVHFVKDAQPEYYLAKPSYFLPTHLPLAPAFQLKLQPVKMEAFTNVKQGIDSTVNTLPAINFKEVLNRWLNMNERDRDLDIAQQAFLFNKSNPNSLITTAYNNSIAIINNRNATIPELKKAQKTLQLALQNLQWSKKEDVLALRAESNRALVYVNKRLSSIK